VIDRVTGALLQFCRHLGGASEGARAIERDGLAAAVVPVAPERAVVNSVAYTNRDELAAAYDELAAAYDEIGAAWTVWVPPGDEETGRFLESRGHFHDASPMAMARDLAGVERPAEHVLADWTADGDLAVVGPLNDRAYDHGSDSFTRALRALPEEATHVYVARDDGEPVACLIMTDHAGNTDVELVAVVPEARGRGLSGGLLAHALVDAAERGCESVTLVSTSMGYPVYERVGFRPFGRFAMWERAPG
jgi:predicted N-acetyltransferase YhbS